MESVSRDLRPIVRRTDPEPTLAFTHDLRADPGTAGRF